MRSRLSLAFALLLLAAPAAAHATIIFEKPSLDHSSIWLANDDGTNTRKVIGNGYLPQISPNGQTIAYVTGIVTAHPKVKIVPTAGGTAVTVVDSWQYGVLKWSPDSHFLVSTAGNLNGKQRLKLIDATTTESRTLARGFFSTASFSPASDQVVYSLTQTNTKLFPKVDLWIAPVAGGAARQLTTHGHAYNPLWGPDRIAYSRYARPKGKHAKDDGPKYNLFLIDPATGNERRLTHDKVPFLLTGLVPTIWSADGTKLVAQFGGQDTTYAVAVNPVDGDETILGSAHDAFVAGAFLGDDTTVLGNTSFVESNDGKTATVPFSGGKLHVILKHAVNVGWAAG
jgi:hypothetical protein